MAGGLLNLISATENSGFLIGNPQKTFFKCSYAKHTNFGLQKFRIDYDGIRDLRLNEESKFSFKIPRYAELLMDTYVVVTLPDIWSPIYHPCSDTNFSWSPYEFKWINDIGANIVKEVEIICGAQTLAKYSGEYIRTLVNRDMTAEKKAVFDRMSGNVPQLNNPASISSRSNAYPSAYYTSSTVGAEPSIRGRNIYVPINAWFMLNSKMAFPLVAIQYNELVINVTLRPIQQLFCIRDVFDHENHFPYIAPDFNYQQYQLYRFLQTPPAEAITPDKYDNKITSWNADIHLLATYCFLTDDEARLFAQESQRYLIKDVYEYRFENVVGTKRLKVGSNGMVSNWTWFLQRNDVNLRNEWSNYSNWPYTTIPFDIQPAPVKGTMSSFVYFDPQTGFPETVGPMLDLSGNSTNIFITGDFNAGNEEDIMQTMGILLDGQYREDTMESGIYKYIDKYARCAGNAPDGIYFYNFGLNTSTQDIQPTGAINMSRFRTIELEITTMVPLFDATASSFNVACDSAGNFLGVNKQNWRLYEYTYNLTLFEERFNILSIVGGNAGLMWAR